MSTRTKPMQLEHGIQNAVYSIGPDQKFHPNMECICGYETALHDSWEDAGTELDEHLKEVYP